MTKKIKVKLILELHEQGMSLNEISRSRHLSKHSTCQTMESAKKKSMFPKKSMNQLIWSMFIGNWEKQE